MAGATVDPFWSWPVVVSAVEVLPTMQAMPEHNLA
jgi:hypothetical protein